MDTSNSQVTDDWSPTPALSSVAQPRALSADSSEPLPSWPTKCAKYSSALTLCGSKQQARAVSATSTRLCGGRARCSDCQACAAGPVFSIQAGQLERGGEAVVVADCGQDVEAAAQKGQAGISILWPWATPARNSAEQLLRPLHSWAGGLHVGCLAISTRSTQQDKEHLPCSHTCCSVSRSSPPSNTRFMRSALYCCLHVSAATRCGRGNGTSAQLTAPAPSAACHIGVPLRGQRSRAHL